MGVTFLQTAPDEADLTTYTFSDENLGTAAADRYIFVTIHGRATGNAAYSVSSVTIGGVSASIAVQQSGSGDVNISASAIALAAVPSGTTGDIVVTFNRSGSVRCTIGVYRVTELDSATAHDTDSQGLFGGTTLSGSLNIPADGFAIGNGQTGDAGTAAWTGLTEDYETNQGSGFYTATGASDEFVSSETGRAVQITWSSANNVDAAFVVGSWAFTAAGGVSGGSTAGIDVSTSGAGTKQAAGGSEATVTADATGTGTKQASGGSTSSISVATTGEGFKTAAGGSSSNLTVDALGDGTKTAFDGSEATVTVTTTGGGQPVTGGSGGSTASITVATTGAGSKHSSGGSQANITVDVSGGGSKHGFGGSESDITVGNPTGALPAPTRVSGSISTVVVPGRV